MQSLERLSGDSQRRSHGVATRRDWKSSSLCTLDWSLTSPYVLPLSLNLFIDVEHTIRRRLRTGQVTMSMGPVVGRQVDPSHPHLLSLSLSFSFLSSISHQVVNPLYPTRTPKPESNVLPRPLVTSQCSQMNPTPLPTVDTRTFVFLSMQDPESQGAPSS